MLSVLYNYYGKTVYLMLLILLFLCLWTKRENILAKKVLVAVTLFCLSFPILYYICEKIGMKDVSYRMFWLIPLSIRSSRVTSPDLIFCASFFAGIIFGFGILIE